MADRQIRVLGPVHLRSGGRRVSVGNDASLRLLASLVAAEGGFVASRELAERLWSDDAPGSRLRMTVARLRARLAEVGLGDALVTMPGGYRLAPPAEAVDATAFVQLARDGRALAVAAPERAVVLLEEALGLWEGQAFEGMGSEPWLAGTVERLRELRLGAEDLLHDLHLRSGRAVAVLDRLAAAVEEEPLREQRWVQLVSALRATSRRSEALRAVDRARRVLGSTVGLGPGPELLALEQDLLRGAPAGGSAAPWASVPHLVGRDPELTHLRRLLRSTRVVVVLGLGGVGKSALATAFAAEVEGSGLPVLRTALDAIGSPRELQASFAATVGLRGTDDPEGLFDALARRAPREGLWVVDGAEAAPEAVAEAVTRLARALPAVRFLVTSRVPLAIAGSAPLPLEPLEVGTEEHPGPAMRVLGDRAGVLLDRAPPADRQAVARLARRAGGLPLALELLAAASARSGLHALAANGPEHAPGLDDSVHWALGAVPRPCRRLLEHAGHLATGFGLRLGGTLAGADDTDLLALLGPAIQSGLLQAVPTDRPGHRYRLPDAVRSAIRAMPRSPEEDRRLHAALCRLGRDVGALHGPADPEALLHFSDELDNVRHWLSRLAGRRAGLELALATARGWKELGLGGEGAEWLHLQIAARSHPPALAGAARIAAASLRSLLDLSPDDRGWLEEALDAVDEAGDVASWLHGSAQLTVVCGWTGEVQRGYELLLGPAAQARMDEVGDPWFRTQRQSVLALGPAGAGLYGEARGWLRDVVDRYLAHGDTSAALESLLIRAVMARVAADWAGARDDLREAQPLLDLGVAQGTVAAIRAEESYVARAEADPSAPRLLLEAIAELERAGSVRLAAGHRQALAAWRVEDGRVDEALAELRVAAPTLLRHAPRGAALALAQVAALVDDGTAALLAGAARRLDEEATGLELSPALRAELDANLAGVEQADPERVGVGRQLTADEILELVAGASPAARSEG